MLLIEASIISILAQPTLSLHQTKQSKRQARSPERFKNIFNPSDADDVSEFINSHGSPLMTRSSAGNILFNLYYLQN